MIRLNKNTLAVPSILSGKGQQATEELKTAYLSGERKFEFDGKIYAHKSVKDALKTTLQHGKCCFCESKVPHIAHGDVEHFRPKGGFRADENSPLSQTGYYWLAYDFSNLFFSCQICNQPPYKGTFFPLRDESKRAYSHLNNYMQEENLILHPSFDEPEKHLSFRGAEIIAKNNSLKAKTTIKRIGLNRTDLVAERKTYLDSLNLLAKYARQGNTEAKAYFKTISQPTAIFSLMVRCNFPDLA